MSTVTLSVDAHIRKVNVRQDLLAVADLIEICFANTLDEDGREYLRHLRWTARDLNYLSWLQGAAERVATPLYGFVWEEDGRITGNLSLIPMSRRGRLTYLIANVAVHPSQRGRGIGRYLTQTALDHLRQRGIETAWLQVREDNPPAYNLYKSLGFVERAYRMTWLSSFTPPVSRTLPVGVSIHRRGIQDWDRQLTWMREIYPPEISWNLPINFTRLNPSPLGQLMRWLRGEAQQNWVARKGGEAIGYLSWEPMRAAADALWLATNEEHEVEAIQALLPYACSMLSGRGRQLSVNYPAKRAMEAFQQAGFSTTHTLVWMSVDLNPA